MTSRRRARKARSNKRKKPAKFNLASRIRSALRKIWLYSPMRREALDRAFVRQIGSVKYRRCAECLLEFPTKGVSVDHVFPCGTMPGTKNATEEDTLDAFVARLFCSSEWLRVLCHECHREVTAAQWRKKK